MRSGSAGHGRVGANGGGSRPGGGRGRCQDLKAGQGRTPQDRTGVDSAAHPSGVGTTNDGTERCANTGTKPKSTTKFPPEMFLSCSTCDHDETSTDHHKQKIGAVEWDLLLMVWSEESLSFV